MDRSFCPSLQFSKIVADHSLLKRVENGGIPLGDVGHLIVAEESYVWVFSDEDMLRGVCQVREGVVAPRVIFPKIIQNN